MGTSTDNQLQRGCATLFTYILKPVAVCQLHARNAAETATISHLQLTLRPYPHFAAVQENGQNKSLLPEARTPTDSDRHPRIFPTLAPLVCNLPAPCPSALAYAYCTATPPSLASRDCPQPSPPPPHTQKLSSPSPCHAACVRPALTSLALTSACSAEYSRRSDVRSRCNRSVVLASSACSVCVDATSLRSTSTSDASSASRAALCCSSARTDASSCGSSVPRRAVRM
eukprot:365383-Chlamydomonas_euryale.AAC.13